MNEAKCFDSLSKIILLYMFVVLRHELRGFIDHNYSTMSQFLTDIVRIHFHMNLDDALQVEDY